MYFVSNCFFDPPPLAGTPFPIGLCLEGSHLPSKNNLQKNKGEYLKELIANSVKFPRTFSTNKSDSKRHDALFGEFE